MKLLFRGLRRQIQIATYLCRANKRERSAWFKVRKAARRIECERRTQNVQDLWLEKIAEIRRMLLGGDLRNFLSWPAVVATMVFDPPRGVLEAIQSSTEWNVLEPALHEVKCGGPNLYEWWPQTSGNLLHQVHHIARLGLFAGGLQRLTGVAQVIEFGGGYGCMCRLWLRLGFKGNYLIYDLPELSVLQEYFLSSCERDVSIKDIPSLEPLSVTLTQNLEAVRKQVAMANGSDYAFIAMWSLSEVPLALREEFMPIINNAAVVLVGFQDQFEDVNNNAFFQALQTKCGSLDWRVEPYPGIANNYYLLGRRAI